MSDKRLDLAGVLRAVLWPVALGLGLSESLIRGPDFEWTFLVLAAGCAAWGALRELLPIRIGNLLSALCLALTWVVLIRQILLWKVPKGVEWLAVGLTCLYFIWLVIATKIAVFSLREEGQQRTL